MVAAVVSCPLRPPQLSSFPVLRFALDAALMVEKVTFHRFNFSRIKRSSSIRACRCSEAATTQERQRSSTASPSGSSVARQMRWSREAAKDVFGRTCRARPSGLGDDEFSPINVPSLKHFWTNLKNAEELRAGRLHAENPVKMDPRRQPPPSRVRIGFVKRPTIRERGRSSNLRFQAMSRLASPTYLRLRG